MIEIDLNKDIKKQFEEKGLSYPILKSSGKWGLRKSTLLDRETEKESIKEVLNYLKERGIIITKNFLEYIIKS